MSHLERKTVLVNGQHYAYLEAGSGPLVVLLHGFPDTADTYEELLPKLAAAGYRAVAPFLRGYHPTAVPADGDYSVATIARDILALIDALGAPDAAVIGHDWGASVAYTLSNLAPERVRKLITLAIPHPRTIRISARLLWRAPHFVVFQFGRLSQWYVERNDLAYIDHLYAYWAPNWRVPAEQVRRVKSAFRQPGCLAAALGYYTALIRDGRDREKQRLYRQRTSVPTLALAGQCDGALDPRAYEATPAAFTGPYDYKVLARAGHFPHREEPEECWQHIQRFLAS